jgi:hypothetical protein
MLLNEIGNKELVPQTSSGSILRSLIRLSVAFMRGFDQNKRFDGKDCGNIDFQVHN